MIILIYLEFKQLLFICLFFMYLFAFCFNHLETPTWSFPENFIRFWLDLAEIFSIYKKKFFCLFVCLFVYWFVCFFVLIILRYQQEVTLKRLWRLDLIRLRYLGSKNMFVCLFVCLLICVLSVLLIMGHPQEVSLKIFRRSDLI